MCPSANFSDLCSGIIIDKRHIMDEKAEKRKFFGSLVIPLILVALMWLVKIIEVSLGIDLGRWGVVPHTPRGLIGI